MPRSKIFLHVKFPSEFLTGMKNRSREVLKNNYACDANDRIERECVTE